MSTLSLAVQALIDPFAPLPDSMMDREWAFKDYDGDGLRFALLQTGLELRELAVQSRQARAAAGNPPTGAQHILAQHQVAYRDVYGAWCGLSEADFDRAPAENEWAVRRTMRHIMRTALFFLTVTRYAVERHRTGDGRPENLSDDQWSALVEPVAVQFGVGPSQDSGGTFSEVKAHFDALQNEITSSLAMIQDAELEWPSWWWESYPQPIRFRLLRFEAHLRQHTIQIEKIRSALDYTPSESHRLIRQVYNALGEAEGAQIGSSGASDAERALITQIEARTREIAHLIS